MRITSSTSAVVELQPVGYQFSGLGSARRGGTPGPHVDWDVNWLVVRGEIRTSEGRSWSFTDPCLTTWDAERLSWWLHAAASEDQSGGLDPAVFTEPNLSFILDRVENGRVCMRVLLSHESLPGWMSGEAAAGGSEYHVALELRRADLAEAADAWDRDRLPFPAR